MATNSQEGAKTPKKRRWYHNIADAYRVTARTFSWIGWVLGGSAIVILALFIMLGVWRGGLIWWIPIGILSAVTVAMAILAFTLRPAMYRQLDGTVGSVYSVISQIKRGWVVDEQPIEVNKQQDVVWRLVGRPGVVLISEGPTSRVMPMLQAERRRVNRAVTNVPVIFIQCGNGDGQTKLSKIPGALRKLKKVLTRQEVPAVAARLNAVTTKGAPIPKGVDPTKARASRRALRGK